MRKTHLPHRYILISAIMLIFLGTAAILIWQQNRTPSAMQEDFLRIASGNYNAAFLSTYPIETYQEEDFSYYRGLSLFKASYCIPDISVLQNYMTELTASDNNIVIVYLGMDPDLISPLELQELLTLYPSVHFEVILSYPSARDWQELSQAAYEKSLEAYCSFLAAAPALGTNVAVYFYGTQEWLVSNPGNYDATTGQLTEPIARTVMLHSDRDHSYQVTGDNAAILADELAAFTGRFRNAPVDFPDLSDYCFVFFGDSIIGNFTDSSSIPGVVNGLSGALSYNLGQNGTCASQLDATMLSLPLVTDAFFQGNLSAIPQDSNVYQGLASYLETPSTDRQLCFVINYGINDYFADAPISSEDPYDIATYCGAIRSSVSTIRANVPDARILLCTPTPITRNQNGTEPQGITGNTLEGYANALAGLSQELGTELLDNYHELDITPENETWFLSDKVHPTHACRYLLGTRILELFR